uniref:Calcium voltage-gated channel auxiliary subunit alpha2delta 4 n=1 Tax=Amphiprion percula TaxID=161767 RepID=A0A3P8TFX4_AMPPE
MKGLKMTIAKHTINTILDTLGENDFVNVIAYTDYVRYVEPCFKGTLVQADLDNREVRLFSASWRLKEANGQGSMCNQAIMLITDGAMEDFESVFEEFNWPERRVRVFTYLIGREMTFAQNTKWIACNNKGYYTHISTLADVQENVMEYLHVLTGQSELSHGILLGVVGSDIPLMEVMKLAPRYMLGAHGYAFLITNNGYILAHPDLRPLYKDGKKLKPKPNYNSVDLSEVEWEDTDEKLRTAMVKGQTGALTLNIRASVDKGVRNQSVHILSAFHIKLFQYSSNLGIMESLLEFLTNTKLAPLGSNKYSVRGSLRKGRIFLAANDFQAISFV